MKAKTRIILKAVFFIFALVLLFFILNKIGFSNLYDNLVAADKLYLGLAVFSTFMLFFSWNFKWLISVREVSKAGFVHTFIVLMAGAFVNTITPGARVGGEPVRAHYLKARYGQSRSRYFATTLVDKAGNLVVFSILSTLSMLFVLLFINIEMRVRIILEIVLALLFLMVVAGAILHKKVKFKREYIRKVLVFLYGLVIFWFLRKKFKTYQKFENFVIGKIEKVAGSTKDFLQKKNHMRANFALAFMMWVFNYAGTFFIFKAIGYDIHILSVVIVVTLSIFIGQFFAIPGGMGIIETIMISLYVALGINGGAAATVAVIDRVIYYVFSLLVGGVCMGYLSIRYR